MPSWNVRPRFEPSRAHPGIPNPDNIHEGRGPRRYCLGPFYTCHFSADHGTQGAIPLATAADQGRFI